MRADREYLAAGYVLGGLSAEETAEAERLLHEDAEFAREVADFDETMALVAEDDEPVAPSDETARAILSIPGQTAEAAPPETAASEHAPESEARPVPDRSRPRRNRPALYFALAASLLLLLCAVLGGTALRIHAENEQLRETVAALDGEQQEAQRLLGAADLAAQHVEVGDGSSVTVSYSVAEQLILVTPHDMADPDEGQDLQMWIIDQDGAHDAGLMTAESPAVITEPSFSADAAFGITVEPEGGSEQPTSEPLVVAEL
ncbi:anti-sigma factor [Nesterenkonia suensis]